MDEDQQPSEPSAPATETHHGQEVSQTVEQISAIMQNAVSGALAAQMSSSRSTTNVQHTQRPVRPSIDVNCTESRWSFFTNEWK